MKAIVTLFALLASAALSFAADGEKPKKPPGEGDRPRPNPEEAFKKLDANADDSISKEEFNEGPWAKKDPAKAAEVFEKKDKNKDGSLDKKEFTSGPKRPPGDKPPGDKPPGEKPPGEKPPGDKPKPAGKE